MQGQVTAFGRPRVCSLHRSPFSQPSFRLEAAIRNRTRCPCKAAASSGEEAAADKPTEDRPTDAAGPKNATRTKDISRAARNVATTFAPRASTASKNPAYPGSLLYKIFETQAWASLAVGGLLSFNVIFPSDEPTIARLMGMWSAWMFTVPSLRARDCPAAEKDALNILFILIPLLNVGLPFVWKSFPFIFSADVIALAAVYTWKVGSPFQSKA